LPVEAMLNNLEANILDSLTSEEMILTEAA
jgi:hypothetical protein